MPSAEAPSELGAFRVTVDDEVVQTRGNGPLRHQHALPTLEGSSACLWSEHPPDRQALARAQFAAERHIRVALQEALEARCLLADRHLHAVDRTIAFLGELDEDRARVGILHACLDVVDASLGALLERTTTGWRTVVELGLSADALAPVLDQVRAAELTTVDSPEFGRVVLVPLGASSGNPLLVALVDSPLEVADAHSVLATVSRLGRVALENAQLVRVAAERQRLRIELELAGRTQEQLMPTSAPVWPGLEVVGHSRPSADCGGDYFDWFPIPERGFFVCVADVSGHGVGAAIVMATLRGYLTASLRQEERLDVMLARVCAMLCDILEPWQFVTVFLAAVSRDGQSLTYCNAGHEAGLLVHAEGTLERLEADVPPLGIDPALAPAVQHAHLAPGDVLVIPTDGLAEAEDAAGELVGRQRFEEWVTHAVRSHATAEGVRSAVLERVGAHRGEVPQLDDETLVVLRRRRER
jgi:serine phosphatase RsbU (regulator of sigma subunit)